MTPDFASLCFDGTTVRITVTLPDGTVVVDGDAHINAVLPDGTVRAGMGAGHDVTFHLPIDVPTPAPEAAGPVRARPLTLTGRPRALRVVRGGAP